LGRGGSWRLIAWAFAKSKPLHNMVKSINFFMAKQFCVKVTIPEHKNDPLRSICG
jgi:hypothetical protein